MAAVSAVRVRDDLVRLAHRGAGLRDFSLGAARILARAVPFDGVCVLTMDPATLLPTGEVVENGLPKAVMPRMTEIEMLGRDFNGFRTLVRSGRLAASLSEATGGDLDRSPRHRELRRPNGFGDELRAVLIDDSATWGALTLLRGSDSGHFSPADSALVASVSGQLAEGLRRATLLAPEPQEDDGPAGLAVLSPDNSIAMANAAAQIWLDELDPGAGLPPVVTAVASHARSIAAGQAAPDVVARARARTPSGTWLLVRGSTLGEGDAAQTVVSLEPARPHELAPLIADAYMLTERERAVTELVAQGLPTNAIAARLFLSPWTVQDHLKSIFEKLDVTSRGELVARLFFEHYAPRLADA